MTLISGCVSVSATGLARDFGTDIQNLAITPAGPMANFLAMGCPFLVPFLGGFAIWFTMMNVAGAAFNLLPIGNSDGARGVSPCRTEDTVSLRTMIADIPDALHCCLRCRHGLASEIR